MRPLIRAVLVALLVSQVACGTLLYPERRFQKPSGRLDPGVVLMDAACMLFFLVPGVVALVVDFATGAIYVPQGQRHFLEPRSEASQPVLALRHGSPLTVRALNGAPNNAHWRFELHEVGDPVRLASWEWTTAPELRIQVPPSLGTGAYEMHVLRNGTPVGRLPVQVSG
jgi:hypothetical protein